MATGSHLGHLDHAERVHESSLAAHVLVLMSCIRSHQQVLVIHVRLVESIIWLLWCRLLALIDSVNLVANDCSLEKLLLRPLLLLLHWLHRLHRLHRLNWLHRLHRLHLLHLLHAVRPTLRQVNLLVIAVVSGIGREPALTRAMIYLHIVVA